MPPGAVTEAGRAGDELGPQCGHRVLELDGHRRLQRERPLFVRRTPICAQARLGKSRDLTGQRLGGGALAQIDRAVGRVGRRLDENGAHPSHALAVGGGAIDGVGVGTGQEADPPNAEAGQDVMDKELGAAVDGVAVDNQVAGAEKLSSVVAMAAMPLQNTKPLSALSHSASRSSRISRFGLLRRE